MTKKELEAEVRRLRKELADERFLYEKAFDDYFNSQIALGECRQLAGENAVRAELAVTAAFHPSAN